MNNPNYKADDIVITAKLMDFDKPDSNGRIYTQDGINFSELALKCKDKRLFGEFSRPSYDRDMSISLAKISHIVEKIWEKYDIVTGEHGPLYGQIRILNTPEGKILKELVNNNCKISFSARCSGKTNHDITTGESTITNIKVYSFDAVTEDHSQ